MGWVVARNHTKTHNTKQTKHITVQARPSDNYFQATAYRLLPPDVDPETAGPGVGLSLGSVALNADVLVPDSSGTIAPGPTTVRGYAFAGDDRGVARVDLSTDGGRTWVQADVDPPVGVWTWSYWHQVVDLAAGRHELVVRAWDTTGACQPEHPATLWNPKGYVNNAWARVTVTVAGP